MDTNIRSNEINEFVSENLNKNFFKNNTPIQMSAAALLFMQMEVPEMDKRALQFAEEQTADGEWLPEIEIVNAEDNFDKLYNLLRKELNLKARSILIEKLINEHAEEAVKKILIDIKKSGNDVYIESAFKLLSKLEGNFTKEITEMLFDMKNAYAQSVACLYLGLRGEEETIIPVYKCYRMLLECYSLDTHSQGPLIGLYKLGQRFGFR